MDTCSLLWPEGTRTGSFSFAACREDLELGRLSTLLFAGLPMARGLELAEEVITNDPAALRWRHDVIGDLLENPGLAQTFGTVQELAAELETCCAAIHANARGLMMSNAPLESFKKTVTSLEKLLRKGGNMLLEELDPDDYHAQFVRATLYFYRHLKCYTRAMTLLRDALTAARLQAPALLALKTWVDGQYQADQIDRSLAQLEKTDAWWTGIAAFSIDVCLDEGMNLESLELSEIRSAPYSKAGMLDRGAEDAFDGLTAMMPFPQSGSAAAYQEYLLTQLGMQAKPELNRLKKELLQLPVAGRDAVAALGRELRFYTSAVGLCRRLQEAGMPVCRPQAAGDGVLLEADDMYMVELALTGEAPAVANPVRLGRHGHIDLITGANSSGKTTYVIAAGQLQWLYQLGYYLPASRAAMRPADAIYTLFAAGESDNSEDSRMGLEVEKIAQITRAMTPDSLVLLNEPMTSTSASEGIEINIDLLSELMDKQVSGMIVTHYNEIYQLLSQRLEAQGLGDRLHSLVMEVDRDPDGQLAYPYRLVEAPPGWSSFARAIVGRLGLNLEAMLEHMTAAGMDMRPGSDAWAHVHPDEKEV